MYHRPGIEPRLNTLRCHFVNFTGQGGREGTEVGSRRSVVRDKTEDRGRRTEGRGVMEGENYDKISVGFC
jgi:hypothetical protein